MDSKQSPPRLPDEPGQDAKKQATVPLDELLDAEFDNALKALDALSVDAEPEVELELDGLSAPTAVDASRALPKSADDALAEADVEEDDFLATLRAGRESDAVGDMPEFGFGPTAPGASHSQVKALNTRIEELETELAAVKEKQIRQAADFDNFRKRLRREKQDAVTLGNESLLKELLPVMDNLRLALDHSEQSDFTDFVAGVNMVHRQILQATNKFGLEPFDSVGKAFDPRLHQAMAQVPSDKVRPGAVADEVQRGYMFYERLLRPSLVTVAMRAPAAPSAPPDDAAETGEIESAPDVVDDGPGEVLQDASEAANEVAAADPSADEAAFTLDDEAAAEDVEEPFADADSEPEAEESAVEDPSEPVQNAEAEADPPPG